MKQRGRKSSAALAVRPAAVQTIERPEPPLDLTPEQVDVWNEIVSTMPADWFGSETHPLLVQLCRHTVDARCLAQLIDQERSKRDGFDPGIYVELLKAQQRESATIKALSTSMRLAQQSRYGARGADGARGRVNTVTPPWHDE